MKEVWGGVELLEFSDPVVSLAFVKEWEVGADGGIGGAEIPIPCTVGKSEAYNRGLRSSRNSLKIE